MSYTAHCEIWLSDGLFVTEQYEKLYEWLDAILEEENGAEFIKQHGFSTDRDIKQAQKRLLEMTENERWGWLNIIERALEECRDKESNNA